MGIDSTNLSCSDVAEVDDFLTLGFLGIFFTVGFLEVFTVGTGTTIFFVAFGCGVELLLGAGMTTFVDAGPLPLRPSMTMWPSWV